VGSEGPGAATAGDGSLVELRPLPAAGAGAEELLVVHPSSVAATRAALAALADRGRPAGVVGFADLTAPNLVDLLDDLVAGPGGRHLRAIASPWPASGPAWLADVAVRRGLACLQHHRLALRLLGPGDPSLLADLASAEPDLEVLVDPDR
jgi:L-fuconolactonase